MRRTLVVAIVLILVVVGAIAVAEIPWNQTGVPSHPGTPNPCAQVYQGQGRGWFVRCKGFLLTETGAVCSLSAGSCTMTTINNETSSEVVTLGCDVMLPIMANGSGANRSITVMDVEGINGGPAASGVQSVSQTGATCWFPTNEYMTNDTVYAVNGCFTFAQVGNLTNTVELCWYYGKWSLAPATTVSLDCPALLSNLRVSFNSVNMTLGQVTISNANSYGVWISMINGTSTVGPLGIAVSGPYVGDWFSIPQNETVPARSTTMLALPGAANAGHKLSYTLSFLPTNESVTYTPPCSVTYQGTYPATSGA